MKKIEEAAQAWANSKSAGANFTASHGDFLAGARYVLDAMTSEDVVDVAFNAPLPNRTGAQSLNPLPSMRAPREHYAAALAAVRKEIEGE